MLERTSREPNNGHAPLRQPGGLRTTRTSKRFASTSGVSHHDHNGQTAARLLNCIFQSSVGLTPVESAESSRQMPVANRVVPAQADNCRYAYHEAATLYIREMLFRDRSTNV